MEHNIELEDIIFDDDVESVITAATATVPPQRPKRGKKKKGPTPVFVYDAEDELEGRALAEATIQSSVSIANKDLAWQSIDRKLNYFFQS